MMDATPAAERPLCHLCNLRPGEPEVCAECGADDPGTPTIALDIITASSTRHGDETDLGEVRPIFIDVEGAPPLVHGDACPCTLCEAAEEELEAALSMPPAALHLVDVGNGKRQPVLHCDDGPKAA